ncbi:hypothetical protein GN109_25590 [Collimonas pratensis]|uniref:hypothetical protein n=1 Tax=Collimonas pratensis TaxID=279113 RepID=UPI00143D75D1|nr:hypothetical protein [Collimonas pratensis]NKI72794.1 hypothetical protein [Collimonas pratensis]
MPELRTSSEFENLCQQTLIAAYVNGQKVSWNSVCTHWEGWNKTGKNRAPFRLLLSAAYVWEKFNSYWCDFLEREMTDDGDTPTGVYLELKLSKYPSLQTMIQDKGDLLAKLVLEGMQPEFIGFLVRPPSAIEAIQVAFFLHSLSSIQVEDGIVILEGYCSEFKCTADKLV